MRARADAHSLPDERVHACAARVAAVGFRVGVAPKVLAARRALRAAEPPPAQRLHRIELLRACRKLGLGDLLDLLAAQRLHLLLLLLHLLRHSLFGRIRSSLALFFSVLSRCDVIMDHGETLPLRRKEEEEDLQRAQPLPFGLFFCLGASAWATVNFVFSELPLLTARGGGYAVACDVSLAIQCSNALPLAHVALSRLLPRSLLLSPRGRSVSVALSTALSVAAAALFAADPWPESRAALLALCALAGGGATLSAVAHYPFAADFAPCYTSALTAGASAGAMLAGVLALAQQPGAAARFSLRVFMLCALAVALAGAAALALLLSLPSCRALRCQRQQHAFLLSVQQKKKKEEEKEEEQPAKPWLRAVLWPGVLLAWLSLVENGLVTGVVTFALLPFGSVALVVAMAVAFFVDPLLSALPGIFPRMATAMDSNVARSVLAVLFTAPCAVVLWFAFESAHPPLANTVLGVAIICSARVAVRGFTAICKVGCWMVLHGHGSGNSIPKAHHLAVSQAGGLAVQIGSFIGAISIFLLVHYTDWFDGSSLSSSNL